MPEIAHFHGWDDANFLGMSGGGVLGWDNFPGHPTDKYMDLWDFLIQELKAPTKR